MRDDKFIIILLSVYFPSLTTIRRSGNLCCTNLWLQYGIILPEGWREKMACISWSNQHVSWTETSGDYSGDLLFLNTPDESLKALRLSRNTGPFLTSLHTWFGFKLRFMIIWRFPRVLKEGAVVLCDVWFCPRAEALGNARLWIKVPGIQGGMLRKWLWRLPNLCGLVCNGQQHIVMLQASRTWMGTVLNACSLFI